MREEHWDEGVETVLAVFLNGNSQFHQTPFTEAVTDDHFYIVMNAHHEDVEVVLPHIHSLQNWHKVLDTASGWSDGEEMHNAGAALKVVARSCWLLRHPH